MIKGLSSSSKYISINTGSSSYPYISPGSVGAGMVRWNSNTNCLEVNDGVTWRQLDMGHANVDFTREGEELLDWAKEKRLEEQRIKDLCEKFPALQKAKDNYDLILNIIKDENENKI